jgi:hypothetical protein
MLSLEKTKTQDKNIKKMTLKEGKGEERVKVNVQEINKTNTVIKTINIEVSSSTKLIKTMLSRK